MNEVWLGLRGAIAVAFGLSLLALIGAPDEGSDQLGAKFAIVAFGLLALPQVFYGFGVGVIGGAWKRLNSAQDAINSKGGLAATGFGTAIGAGGFHAAVSSNFVRVEFQIAALFIVFVLVSFFSLLLLPLWNKSDNGSNSSAKATLFAAIVVWVTIAAVIFAVALFVAKPSVIIAAIAAPISVVVAYFVSSRTLGFFESFLTKFAFIEKQGALLLVALLGLAGIVIVGAGSQLNVWTTLTLASFATAAVGTPIAYLLQQKVDLPGARGTALAGTLAALVCFFAAAPMSSENPDMRQLVTGQRTALATHATIFQKVADRDGDGYAQYFGGYDCDDSNPKAFPGAEETPGNGIDEDCSGADSEPIVREHQGIAATRRAIRAAFSELAKVNSKLPDPPKNIVFFIIDTLRYDHLGFAGYERNTSPNIDKIAAESAVFERTYATSPHTPRSIPAMFLSRYASKTDWRGGQYNYPKIKPENLSVFELLEGYENVGITSHFYFQKKQGIQQGFTKWDNAGFGTIAESNVDIAAPRIFKKLVPVIQDLGKSEKPFALFVHLFEPHAKWIGHKEFDFGKGETTAEKHINNYNSEIAYVDQYVGKIVAQLKAQGIWDNSIVVLTSDHGEAFMEHGFFYHGQTLYNEVIHVPLLVRVPGWPAKRISTPTSIVDIAPTLTELVGVPSPEKFQGVSLVPAMVGQPLPKRPVFAELLPYTSWKEHHRAVIDGDWKMIHVVSAGRKELYNLSDDPGEKQNLFSSNPDKVKELTKHLEAFQALE